MIHSGSAVLSNAVGLNTSTNMLLDTRQLLNCLLTQSSFYQTIRLALNLMAHSYTFRSHCLLFSPTHWYQSENLRKEACVKKKKAQEELMIMNIELKLQFSKMYVPLILHQSVLNMLFVQPTQCVQWQKMRRKRIFFFHERVSVTLCFPCVNVRQHSKSELMMMETVELALYFFFFSHSGNFNKIYPQGFSKRFMVSVVLYKLEGEKETNDGPLTFNYSGQEGVSTHPSVVSIQKASLLYKHLCFTFLGEIS